MCESKLQKQLALVEKITHKSSMELNDIIFKYGGLNPQDAEWHILLSHTREILKNWRLEIELQGFMPLDGWKVIIPTDEGDVLYELPHAEFISTP